MDALNLNSVMVGSDNPKALAEFYREVLGKKPDMEEGEMTSWMVGGTFLSIYEHSEVKGKAKEPQRIILNLETPDVKNEYGRIKKLHAEVVKEPYEIQGMWIATFADPDGNYFQLMSPWEDPK